MVLGLPPSRSIFITFVRRIVRVMGFILLSAIFVYTQNFAIYSPYIHGWTEAIICPRGYFSETPLCVLCRIPALRHLGSGCIGVFDLQHIP
jgi:hypothetical protein